MVSGSVTFLYEVVNNAEEVVLPIYNYINYLKLRKDADPNFHIISYR